MAHLSPASAAAAPLTTIAYDLRDGSNDNEVLASDSLPRDQIVSVADLRRVVFAANEGLLPPKYPYTLLDVYPPGSTDSDRSAAAKARSTIASLLPHAAEADDTFVVIARPLPSFGGARGQPSHSPHAALRVIRPRRLLWPHSPYCHKHLEC